MEVPECPAADAARRRATKRWWKKSGSSPGQADGWNRRSRQRSNATHTSNAQGQYAVRGVSGHAALSGQCYTAVTPPRFRRGKCDARHSAVAVLRRIYLIALPNRGPDSPRGPRHKAVDDAVFTACFARLSQILLAGAVRKTKLPNCRFVHRLLTKMKC
jgi:hypothetical protein